jgi:hypothetical protein
MRVVYEKSIVDKIRTAKTQSEEEGTTIDYIEITRGEEQVLKTYYLDTLNALGAHDRYAHESLHNKHFLEVRIKVEGCKL